MDIRAFFGRRPGTPYASGLAYEYKVHNRIRRLLYNNLPVLVSTPAGANRTAHDLVINNFTLEVKTKRATEGGGCVMRLRDGVIQMPDNSILRTYLPPDLRIWDGRIPSFLLGDTSPETWAKEKPMFKGLYIDASSSAVADYYQAKGTRYMQIEDKGIYHTGCDILQWGVPKFEPKCRIRIRAKQHHSGSVPQDVQASFNYNPKTLPPTPYDFMDTSRLPPGFTLTEG